MSKATGTAVNWVQMVGMEDWSFQYAHMSIVPVGQLCIAKGELQMASDSFKIVLDEDENNFPALLGQASVYFLMGEAEQQHKKSLEHYRNSLDLYKKALRVYCNCPAAVRLGIAFCRYKLGQVEKARQAFQRVLELDPQNVDAPGVSSRYGRSRLAEGRTRGGSLPLIK
ncbi:protein CTR9 homolog [Zea mays]|uniref:protein CTR9 homolog n=1 Tax=Zea mays TaxID=4577 RepID=UPI001652E294|nr:protein CTR9 homolog [Zea mays]